MALPLRRLVAPMTLPRIDGTRPRAGLGKVGKDRKNRRDAAPRREVGKTEAFVIHGKTEAFVIHGPNGPKARTKELCREEGSSWTQGSGEGFVMDARLGRRRSAVKREVRTFTG